jgi:predicted amidohydrolase YtcJ
MILLFNGHVGFPGNSTLPGTAIAIEKDRILATGSDEDVLNLAVPGCEKINLCGKTVWPGLTDSHLHLETLGAKLDAVDCDTPTQAECLQQIQQKADSLDQADAWIRGNGWNQNLWQGGFGTAAELDAVTRGHPAFLYDQSLHSAWVNTRALELAGINKDTPNPKGGVIRRDQSGNPTGILHESAVRLVEKIIPGPSLSEREVAMRKAQAFLNRLGVTSVCDFDPLTCRETLEALQQKDELTLRVSKGIPIEKLDWAIENGLHTGDGDDFLKWGWIKMFADGALGPQTAAMLQPYETDATNVGQLLFHAEEILARGIKAVSNGLSLAIHAIGDRATHEVLQGFARLREYEKQNHLVVREHRVEHLQLLAPGDIGAAASLGVVTSMQPIHVLTDMFTADKQWGKRAEYAYAFNSLLKKGSRLIFGSDAPVESPNPFLGMYAAVTRRRQDGSPSAAGWYPVEKITIADAVRCYTVNPAGIFRTGSGALNRGDLADIIILEKYPYQVEADELGGILPQKVMVAGRWIDN